MQALSWMRRMSLEWKEEKGYHQEGHQRRKMNCVKPHNMTFTRPRLRPRLPMEGEEKAFPEGRPFYPDCCWMCCRFGFRPINSVFIKEIQIL